MAAPRKLFIAGSTGVVGKTIVRQADARGVDIVPLVRPKSATPGATHPKAAICELSDPKALSAAMAGCTTVLQLIGTMRNRFNTGDTYEVSDIGTTRQLVEAAKATGGVDHFVLLSSVGAGRPMGAYLKAKAAAEALVTQSGLPYTIFRPSAFTGAEGRQVPGFATALTKMLGFQKYVPIEVEELAWTLLFVATERAAVGSVLEGPSLWAEVERVRAARA